MSHLPLSALEVAVVQGDFPPAASLRNCEAAATELDRLGYHRLWFAEHHHSPAIGVFPPPIMTAHIAAATSHLRVGAGGVLAPNHAPLTVAEQFTTLAALHPDRIDLGIGRGPGTFHESTARALRRGAGPATDEEYKNDVAAILLHLREYSLGRLPEPWLLASSEAGAALAAHLGLPIAVAHHIRPQNTVRVLERYREQFRPSPWCENPYALICVETVCADTEERAAELKRPMDIIKSRLLAGRSEEAFVSPTAAAAHHFTAEESEQLAAFGAHQAYGTPESVTSRLTRLADATAADELMLVTPVYDVTDRIRSFELVRKALSSGS